jgi:hypothetical protein
MSKLILYRVVALMLGVFFIFVSISLWALDRPVNANHSPRGTLSASGLFWIVGANLATGISFLGCFALSFFLRGRGRTKDTTTESTQD